MNNKKYLPLCLILTACSVSPDYVRPEIKVPDRWSFAGDKVDPTSDHWWASYNDPILNDLIDQALKANLDLMIAVEKVKESRAGYDAQLTSWLPTIGLGTSVQRDRNSFPLLGIKKPYDTWKVGYDASWEIDLFGGNRRMIEAAEAQAIGAEWGLIAARQIIISEVVRTYLQYIQFQELSKITQETKKNQDEQVY